MVGLSSEHKLSRKSEWPKTRVNDTGNETIGKKRRRYAPQKFMRQGNNFLPAQSRGGGGVIQGRKNVEQQILQLSLEPRFHSPGSPGNIRDRSLKGVGKETGKRGKINRSEIRSQKEGADSKEGGGTKKSAAATRPFKLPTDSSKRKNRKRHGNRKPKKPKRGRNPEEAARRPL